MEWEQIGVPNATDGVEACPDHLVVEGDTLHVLLTVANRVDAVTVIVDVPLARSAPPVSGIAGSDTAGLRSRRPACGRADPPCGGATARRYSERVLFALVLGKRVV